MNFDGNDLVKHTLGNACLGSDFLRFSGAEYSVKGTAFDRLSYNFCTYKSGGRAFLYGKSFVRVGGRMPLLKKSKEVKEANLLVFLKEGPFYFGSITESRMSFRNKKQKLYFTRLLGKKHLVHRHSYLYRYSYLPNTYNISVCSKYNDFNKYATFIKQKNKNKYNVLRKSLCLGVTIIDRNKDKTKSLKRKKGRRKLFFTKLIKNKNKKFVYRSLKGVGSLFVLFRNAKARVHVASHVRALRIVGAYIRLSLSLYNKYCIKNLPYIGKLGRKGFLYKKSNNYLNPKRVRGKKKFEIKGTRVSVESKYKREFIFINKADIFLSRRCTQVAKNLFVLSLNSREYRKYLNYFIDYSVTNFLEFICRRHGSGNKYLKDNKKFYKKRWQHKHKYKFKNKFKHKYKYKYKYKYVYKKKLKLEKKGTYRQKVILNSTLYQVLKRIEYSAIINNINLCSKSYKSRYTKVTVGPFIFWCDSVFSYTYPKVLSNFLFVGLSLSKEGCFPIKKLQYYKLFPLNHRKSKNKYFNVPLKQLPR